MRTIRIVALLYISIFLGCSDPSKQPIFNLEGQSSLCLINNTSDSLDFRIRDNAIWPEKANYDVGVLAPGESKVEKRKSQGRNDYYLSIGDKDINLYAYPGSVDTVTINRIFNGKLALTYSGDLKEVNDFLAKKSDHFNSYYSDRNSRSSFMINKTNALRDIYEYNDSITQAHKAYIMSHGPEKLSWFKDYEVKRMDYLNAWYKMNAVFYRVKTLNQRNESSADLISKPYDDLSVEDVEMLGNRDYMSFLYQYISYQIEFNSKEESKARASRSQEIAKRLKVINTELTGEVNQAYLTCELSQYIDRGLLYDSAWLDLVTEKKYIAFLSNVKSYYSDHH